MFLSKTCIYGLRASALLASKSRSDYTTIRELSDELDISFHFLTKVLQKLSKSELLESYKGPNGGVKLAREAVDINFMDVVLSIDGDFLIHECALGLPRCGILKPCPMHDEWSGLKQNIVGMMETITLKDLSNNYKTKHLILKQLDNDTP